MTDLPSPTQAKKIRKRAGVTLEESGAAVRVSGPTIRNWEAGRSTPTQSNARKYGLALATLQRGEKLQVPPTLRPLPSNPFPPVDCIGWECPSCGWLTWTSGLDSTAEENLETAVEDHERAHAEAGV